MNNNEATTSNEDKRPDIQALIAMYKAQICVSEQTILALLSVQHLQDELDFYRQRETRRLALHNPEIKE